MTLTSFDVANHWPFLERNLILSRNPAMRRVLRVLAQSQVDRRGEPVPMRRALLEVGTLGQAGNGWRALAELERRGVAARYEGRGRQPDLWHFLAYDFGKRWRMPWVRPARSVAHALEGCSTFAGCPFVARFPGQGGAKLRDRSPFRLDIDDHLVVFGPVATQTETGARLVTAPPNEQPVETRDNGASQPSPIPLLGSYFVTTPLHEDEEKSETEAGKAVARAISELTGHALYGKPRRRLMAAMGTGLEAPAVIAVLQRMAKPSFEGCVVRVEDLASAGRLPMPPAAANAPARAEQDRLARLVEEYREAGELEEAAYYESRLAAVGGQ